MSTTGDVDSAAPRALTAAEKRAARRARVLEGGEMRMKLVTGEIGSLKSENDTSLDRAMDEGIKELLDATELPEQSQQPGDAAGIVAETEPGSASGEIKIPPRVDPAQRRRDAHARRQKKEAMVQELLSGGASATTTTTSTATVAHSETAVSPEAVDAESVSSVRNELSSSNGGITNKPPNSVEPVFSRHSIALRLQSAEEKIILLLIFGAAIYVAFATDLRNVTTDLLTSDPRFLSYQQLVSNGVPLESIRQQMHRENMEPSLLQQIERVFAAQRKSEMSSSSSSLVSSLIPNLLDLPGFFTSLMVHPPIILCVLLLRVVVSLVGSSIHSVLKLPEVKNPQEDDLGFVANLALASRPALKGYIAKARKSVDDLFFFLWSFVLTVAVRAIAIARF